VLIKIAAVSLECCSVAVQWLPNKSVIVVVMHVFLPQRSNRVKYAMKEVLLGRFVAILLRTIRSAVAKYKIQVFFPSFMKALCWT
jgi:hypothetical protein